MANTPQQPDTRSGQQEHYTHGYDTKFIEYLRGRKVSTEAAFLVPHLRSGMSLIDCGCGPGTITVGLAELVAPGQVVGIDIEGNQIDLARDHTLTRGVANVRFEVANIYELPFADHSFDAAYAHTVLQHLTDPVKALKEMRRVLKPGGVIGVREEDTGGVLFSPSTPTLDESMELYVRCWKHNGGDPYFARRHRAVLREAGFVRVEGMATCEYYGTPEATRAIGEVMARFIRSSIQTAVQLGWVDEATVEKIGAAWKSWGEHPDAYLAMVRCEAVGWKE